MNRFVIVDGLPYLFADGKTHAVRWDHEGFTVGAEVKLASVPSVTHSELAIKAKCAENLDSIGAAESIGVKKKAGRKKTAKAVIDNDPDA